MGRPFQYLYRFLEFNPFIFLSIVLNFRNVIERPNLQFIFFVFLYNQYRTQLHIFKKNTNTDTHNGVYIYVKMRSWECNYQMGRMSFSSSKVPRTTMAPAGCNRCCHLHHSSVFAGEEVVVAGYLREEEKMATGLSRLERGEVEGGEVEFLFYFFLC